VKVLVEGASMNPERTKKIIPVFEEGTVDDDLLNEGQPAAAGLLSAAGLL